MSTHLPARAGTLLALCWFVAGCGSDSDGSSKAMRQVGPDPQVSGTMTLADGSTAAEVSGFVYYDRIYEGVHVMFAPWAGARCLSNASFPPTVQWLGITAEHRGKEVVSFPLNGKLSGGLTWEVLFQSDSQGIVGKDSVSGTVTDLQLGPAPAPGDVVSGRLVYATSGASSGDLTFSLPYCGDD